MKNGPYIISQRLYRLLFGSTWNKQAYKLCSSEGYIAPKLDILLVSDDLRLDVSPKR